MLIPPLSITIMVISVPGNTAHELRYDKMNPTVISVLYIIITLKLWKISWEKMNKNEHF